MRILSCIVVVLLVGCDSYSTRRQRARTYTGSRGIAASDVHTPEEGLLALFSFDGGVSNVLSDRHDGINHGATFGPDRFGSARSAVHFDGVDDYITVTQSNLLQVQLPVSISYWVNLDQNATTSAAIATNNSAEANTGVFAAFDSNGGNPSISIGDGGRLGGSSRRTLHASSSLTPGEWYHIVGVVESASEMRIYVNAEADSGRVDGGAENLRYGIGSVEFGRRVATSGQPPIYFAGALDDVGIYGIALDDAQVRQLYSGQR